MSPLMLLWMYRTVGHLGSTSVVKWKAAPPSAKDRLAAAAAAPTCKACHRKWAARVWNFGRGQLAAKPCANWILLREKMLISRSPPSDSIKFHSDLPLSHLFGWIVGFGSCCDHCCYLSWSCPARKTYGCSQGEAHCLGRKWWKW